MIAIVVEGRSDKLKLQQVLAEDVTIVCTNGTIAEDALLELLEPFEEYQLYTLFDADRPGERLQKLMRRTYSDAIQLEIPAHYIEVAETPNDVLCSLLSQEKIKTK